MTTTFDTATVLRTAANLLEERGWHPIGLGTSGGPLSLMGALAEAAGLDETDPDLMTSPYVAAYHSRAAVNLMLGDIRAAIADYSAALQIAPDPGGAFAYRRSEARAAPIKLRLASISMAAAQI